MMTASIDNTDREVCRANDDGAQDQKQRTSRSDMNSEEKKMDPPSSPRHHHVHFSSCRRRPSQTKSWTDQAAPEPFTLPTKTLRKTKYHLDYYGHGDASSGDGGNVTRSGGQKSVHGVFRRSGSALRASNRLIHGSFGDSVSDASTATTSSARMTKETSFAQEEFPQLSPVKPKQPSSFWGREQSWSSAVLGGTCSARVDESNVGDRSSNKKNNDADECPFTGIPPPPLSDLKTLVVDTNTANSSPLDISQSYGQQRSGNQCSRQFKGEKEAVVSQSYPPSRDSFMASQQRIQMHEQQQHESIQAKQSFSPPTPTTSKTRHTSSIKPHNPYESFTTLSISALQNDTGTILARSNRVDEAMERYVLCILSARAVLDGLRRSEFGREWLDEVSMQTEALSWADAAVPPVHTTARTNVPFVREVSITSRRDDAKKKEKQAKCPKVTEAEGLAWFYQKLLRGDVAPAPPVVENDIVSPLQSASSLPNGNTFLNIPDLPGHTGSLHCSPPNDQSPSNTSSFPPPTPPFQPAGFGGVALLSPRRLRSASFGGVDVVSDYPSLSRSNSNVQKSNLFASTTPSLPLRPSAPPLGISKSCGEKHVNLHSSPVTTKVALSSTTHATILQCPLTAPHPGKQQTLLTKNYKRSSSHSNIVIPPYRLTPKPPIAPLDDIVYDIHQHQKLDCPEDVYSCNGRTPLGLEYVCDPLPVLGGELRRMVMASHRESEVESFGILESGSGDLGERLKKRKRITTFIMESAALIAAGLNLASLEYRRAGGGVSEKLQHVLDTLNLALEDCKSTKEALEKQSDGEQRSNKLFQLLEVVAHVNIGTVLYRMSRIRDSMASFESARQLLEKKKNDGIPVQFDYDDDVKEDRDEAHPHDDNRFPPQDYLLLVTRVNLSRASLRLNNPDNADELCKLICNDNKPHRKSSSRLLLHRSSSRGLGFRRSNSFSTTTSALNTSTAAYQHDLDRRSKWLVAVANHYLTGLVHEARGEPDDYKSAVNHYNRLLSLARVKLDHRHAYICALLERRGAVLFEQRKLQCSMLSYLACLKILEHQQSTGNNVFNKADLARVLYAVARVLHDKEEYHDALHMYQRALVCQRVIAADSGKPSLAVITTLCNISRMHHLSGEIDAALNANKEVLELATLLVGGKVNHPFLIHRLKVEGNILVEAGRLEDAMRTFVKAARRCDQMMSTMMGGTGASQNSQEDADAGDSSVLSIRSAASLAHISILHPAAASA